MLTTAAQAVLKATKQAYWECWNPDEDDYAIINKQRDLSWRASVPVSPTEASSIMCEALGVKPDEYGYNEFKPDLLLNLPPDMKVYLARESSVCVYVVGDFPWADDTEEVHPLTQYDDVHKVLGCDECDKKDGETRLWWD